MKLKKLLLCSISVLLLIVGTSCDDHPDWQDDIHVPYFESTTDNSAAHCVALWSAYDGRWISESVIADSMNCLSGLDCLNAVESGINTYTWSIAWESALPGTDAGQNEALAISRAAIVDHSPAILPFWEDEFFLLTAASGSHDGIRKIAEEMRFHILHREDKWISVSDVKVWFIPIHNYHFVITGSPSHRSIGIQEYQQFVDEGGTYLGAPKNYNPDTSHSGN
jgi:hypothetical protein